MRFSSFDTEIDTNVNILTRLPQPSARHICLHHLSNWTRERDWSKIFINLSEEFWNQKFVSIIYKLARRVHGRPEGCHCQVFQRKTETKNCVVLLSSTTLFGGHEDNPILNIYRDISQRRPVCCDPLDGWFVCVCVWPPDLLFRRYLPIAVCNNSDYCHCKVSQVLIILK